MNPAALNPLESLGFTINEEEVYWFAQKKCIGSKGPTMGMDN